MNEFFTRLLLAALISCSGLLATYYWDSRQKLKIVPDEPEPVARIVSVTNDVMRRPAQHLIWKSAARKEELFAGEAVRTANNSEAQIEFLDQGTTIQLDPDSVIEISRNKEGVNLDFLKGNLFIKTVATAPAASTSASPKAPISTITVRSGEHKITLPTLGGELALAKTTTAAPMEVEVFKGDIRESKPPSKDSLTPKIHILSPRPGEATFVEKGAKTLVEFMPIGKAYQVTLEAGENRTKLERVADLTAVSGASGQIEAPFPIGKTYFRLIATHPDGKTTIESQILRTDIRLKTPPEGLAPLDQAKLRPEGTDKHVVFDWANPGRLKFLQLEISQSPKMKPLLKTESLDEKSFTRAIALGLERGPIYWRVSGTVPDTRVVSASPVHMFTLLPQTPDPVPAPTLASPRDHGTIPLLEARTSGVALAWNPVRVAVSYKVTLTEEGGRSFSVDTKSTSTTVEKLKSGTYSWKVEATDENAQVSASSPTWTFTIDGVPALAWSDNRTEEKIVYKAQHPTLKAAWSRGPGSPVSWRFRVTKGREPASEDPSAWTITKRPDAMVPLEGDGEYRIEAEALDGAGVVLARAPARTMTFELAPPPAPPNFDDALPASLQASDFGAVDVTWSPAPEAREYQVQLVDADGKVVRSDKTKTTKSSYTSLKPGNYQVVLQSIDSLGRLGPKSEPRPLLVPNYSTVRAPKIKTLNIK